MTDWLNQWSFNRYVDWFVDSSCILSLRFGLIDSSQRNRPLLYSTTVPVLQYMMFGSVWLRCQHCTVLQYYSIWCLVRLIGAVRTLIPNRIKPPKANNQMIRELPTWIPRFTSRWSAFRKVQCDWELNERVKKFMIVGRSLIAVWIIDWLIEHCWLFAHQPYTYCSIGVDAHINKAISCNWFFEQTRELFPQTVMCHSDILINQPRLVDWGFWMN